MRRRGYFIETYTIMYQDAGVKKEVTVSAEELIPVLLQKRRNFEIVEVKNEEIDTILKREKDRLLEDWKDISNKKDVLHLIEAKMIELIQKDFMFEREFIQRMKKIRKLEEENFSLQAFKEKVIAIYLEEE